MKYFILRHTYIKPDYVSGSVDFSPQLPTYYRMGEELPQNKFHVSVKLHELIRKIKVDFFMTTSGAFFASTELANLLQAYQKQLRVIPAISTYHNGKPTEKNYSLIHLSCKIDCFDYEKSEYGGKALILQQMARGEAPNMVKVIKQLVVDSTKAGENHIFFIKNVLLLDPIISESLAKAIEERGFEVNLEALAPESA